MIAIAVFFVVPVAAAFVMSFTDFDIYALADIGNLRKVNTVFMDGYRLDGAALRTASGLSGMPE